LCVSKSRFILEKCDGVIVIENKKRKVLFEELKKRGYEPDPVKVWKIRHNKDEALVST
jgi:DNA topoisomerase-2